MRVYIASSFKHIDRVKEVAHIMEKMGHTITEKWWERVYDIDGEKIVTTELKDINDSMSTEEFYKVPETIQSFALDYQGVKTADMFVFVASERERKYNGASAEYGIAIGKQIPVFLVGNLEKSVLFTPMIRCKDYHDLIGKVMHYTENHVDVLRELYTL